MYDDDDYEDEDGDRWPANDQSHEYEPHAGDYRPLMCCDRCSKHMSSSDRSPYNERLCRGCYRELRRERGY